MRAVWNDLTLDAYQRTLEECYRGGGAISNWLSTLEPNLLLLGGVRHPPPRSSKFSPSSILVSFLCQPTVNGRQHRTLFSSPIDVQGESTLLSFLAPFDVLARTELG